MKINLDEIKFKIKFLEDGKLKAIVTFDFGDFLVKGFRVMESQYPNEITGEKLWFLPPSYKGGPKYHPIFFMPDKEMWQAVQRKFWNAYELLKKEHYRKRMQVSKDELDHLS